MVGAQVWRWQLHVVGAKGRGECNLDLVGAHMCGGGSCMWLVPTCVAVAVDVVSARVCGSCNCK